MRPVNLPDLERAVLGPDGAIHSMKPGSVFIDASTIDPTVTRKVGAALAAKGIEPVDCPLGKTADHAVAGTLTLILGGRPEVIEQVRPVLECVGKDFFYCGELGMGQAMKLTNNFLSAAILTSTVEALVMGVKAGLSLETMTSVMRTTMAWNNHLGVSLPRKALADDFSPGFKVRLAEKDQRLAMQFAAALGSATGAKYFYKEAPDDILQTTRAIEAVCAHHGVPLAAAALQFALGHPVVASVATGMVSPEEVSANIEHFSRPIPEDFWLELKYESLLRRDAPTPTGKVPHAA